VFSCDFNIKMLLFELDFEEVSKKKLRECWSQLCRIRCSEQAGEQQKKQQLHFLRSEEKKGQERREREDTARDWVPKLALQRRRVAYLKAEQPWDHGPAS